MSKSLSPSELSRLREIEADGGKGFSGRQPHVTEKLVERKLLRRVVPEAHFMLSRNDVELTELGRAVLVMGGMLEGELRAPARLAIIGDP